MRLLPGFIICMLFSLTLSGQQKCGTMEMLNYSYTNTSSKKIVSKKLKDFVENNHQHKVNPGEVYTIPTVVHVVWRNESENLPDGQIYNGIAVLNEDFRKLNNIENVVSEFQNSIADAEIEFCLANIDPQGNPTNGINRVKTTAVDFGESYLENKIKYTKEGGVDAWPTDEYFNIWIGDLSSFQGLLGYAQFPDTGEKETDGVVLNLNSFGRANGIRILDDGTAAHEVGHWLGLFHIWGDDEDCNTNIAPNCVCSGNDRIRDTNNSAGPASGCIKSINSCGSRDMIQNFMDYSTCSDFFTQGQVNVMRSQFEEDGFRNSILKSGKCATPMPNDVAVTKIDFPAPNETVCTENFKPKVTIANNGSNSLNNVVINVKLDNGGERRYVWEGDLSFAEYYTIELDEVFATEGSNNISISVVSVNDVMDENSSNNTIANDFSIQIPSADNLPFREGFENGWPNNRWISYNFDDSLFFDVTDTIATFDKNCLILNSHNYQIPDVANEIVSKNLELRSFTNPKLRFFYAYAGINEFSRDEFMVLLSPDCSLTFDTLFYAKGEELATRDATEEIFEPVASDWDRVVIDLSAYENLKFANFHFKFINGWGNNFYLDDISIFGEEKVLNTIEIYNENLIVYPNPFKNEFTITLPAKEIKNKLNEINIFDASGKTIYTSNYIANDNKIKIDAIIERGVYIVVLSLNNKNYVSKIIKL